MLVVFDVGWLIHAVCRLDLVIRSSDPVRPGLLEGVRFVFDD